MIYTMNRTMKNEDSRPQQCSGSQKYHQKNPTDISKVFVRQALPARPKCAGQT
jgi:hypothetical protein